MIQIFFELNDLNKKDKDRKYVKNGNNNFNVTAQYERMKKLLELEKNQQFYNFYYILYSINFINTIFYFFFTSGDICSFSLFA